MKESANKQNGNIWTIIAVIIIVAIIFCVLSIA
jgi:uncharacterized integral membrane protein